MRTRVLPLLVITLGIMAVARAQESRSLELTQTVTFPSLHGGFNHMSVDAKRQRLFAAAPTNATVEVIDLRSGKPLRSLKSERPAAVRYAPEFDQLYVSSGQRVYVYDGETLNVIISIDLQSRLDELQYDAQAKELYVGCMSEGETSVAVIAIPSGKLQGKIPLPGRPQGIAVEQKGSRIFANVPSHEKVAVVDRRRRALHALWPVKQVKGNTPIALDAADHRLFLGGREPPRLIVLDTRTGNQVAEVSIDGFADDMFWDPARRLIYISCGEGFVDVIEQRDADHYLQLQRVTTVEGAATSAFSPELDGLYVGVPRREDKPAEIRVFKIGR